MRWDSHYTACDPRSTWIMASNVKFKQGKAKLTNQGKQLKSTRFLLHRNRIVSLKRSRRQINGYSAFNSTCCLLQSLLCCNTYSKLEFPTTITGASGLFNGCQIANSVRGMHRCIETAVLFEAVIFPQFRTQDNETVSNARYLNSRQNLWKKLIYLLQLTRNRLLFRNFFSLKNVARVETEMETINLNLHSFNPILKLCK